ncbi:MAG: hypothetical protein ACRDYD_07900 [Acidimicrobiales bacterium]
MLAVGSGALLAGPEADLLHLLVLVPEAAAGATDALLAGDREIAAAVASTLASMDDLCARAASAIAGALGQDGLPRAELLRLAEARHAVPEIASATSPLRCVLQAAQDGLGAELTPRCRGLVQRLAELACDLWRLAADAAVDGGDGRGLDRAGAQIDLLEERLWGEMLSASTGPGIALRLVPVARTYVRLAFAGASVTRRAWGWQISGEACAGPRRGG